MGRDVFWQDYNVSEPRNSTKMMQDSEEEEDAKELISINENRGFVCTKCLKPLSSKRRLAGHSKICKGPKPEACALLKTKTFFCDTCNRQFKSQQKLNMHNPIWCKYQKEEKELIMVIPKQKVELKEKAEFICVFCNRDMITKANLEKHHNKKISCQEKWNHFKDKPLEILAIQNHVNAIRFFDHNDIVIYQYDPSIWKTFTEDDPTPPAILIERFLFYDFKIKAQVVRLTRSLITGDILISVRGPDERKCQIAGRIHDKCLIFFVYEWKKSRIVQHCFHAECVQKKPHAFYISSKNNSYEKLIVSLLPDSKSKAHLKPLQTNRSKFDPTFVPIVEIAPPVDVKEAKEHKERSSELEEGDLDFDQNGRLVIRKNGVMIPYIKPLTKPKTKKKSKKRKEMVASLIPLPPMWKPLKVLKLNFKLDGKVTNEGFISNNYKDPSKCQQHM